MTITDTQRQRRSRGIGSSESAALLGLSPWINEADVLAEKLGRVEPSPEPPSAAARLGTAIEPVIAELLEEDHGIRLVCPTATFEAANGVMLANPDRFVGRCARGEPIAEMKHTRIRNGWGPTGTDMVPDAVMIQVQHQMLCTGSPYCLVARLDAFSADLSVYTVQRSEDLIGIIERRCVTWWETHVVKGEPLPAGSAPPSEDLLKRIRRVGGTSTPIAAELIDNIEMTRAALTAAEAAHSAARAAGIDALRDAEIGLAPDGRRLTYFACRDGVRFDADAFRAAHPDLYAQFLTTRKGYRTLRIVNPKGAE